MKNGLYAALLTPMHEDLSCDIGELTRHAKSLIEEGCAGIVLFGTTGEGASFSLDEKLFILKGVINAGISPEKIVIANGSSNIPDTAALIKEALYLGCTHALVAPPSFYKNISDEGVISFYKEVIKRVNNESLQLLLYHIPQLSGVPITLNVIKALKSKVVIGIKESEGNLAFTKEILQNFPDFQVFVGKESTLLEAMNLGASGAICGLANLFPKELLSLYAKKPISLPQIQMGRHFIASFKKVMQERHGNAWHALRPPLTYD